MWHVDLCCIVSLLFCIFGRSSRTTCTFGIHASRKCFLTIWVYGQHAPRVHGIAPHAPHTHHNACTYINEMDKIMNDKTNKTTTPVADITNTQTMIGTFTIKHSFATSYCISGSDKTNDKIMSEPKTTTIECMFERQSVLSHAQRELSQIAIKRAGTYRRAKNVPTTERIVIGSMNMAQHNETPRELKQRVRADYVANPYDDEQWLPICDYLDADIDMAKRLCGIDPTTNKLIG